MSNVEGHAVIGTADMEYPLPRSRGPLLPLARQALLWEGGKERKHGLAPRPCVHRLNVFSAW